MTIFAGSKSMTYTTPLALGAPGQAGGWGVRAFGRWPHKQNKKSEYKNYYLLLLFIIIILKSYFLYSIFYTLFLETHFETIL